MFDFDDVIVFNIIVTIFGILYGVIAQRNSFCFSGGLKDTIIIGNTQRSTSILVAMITSVLATQALVFAYDIDLQIPRYFLNINYAAIVIGGFIFGYGMMKSDGCGSRHLVKFAQGDKTSLYVLIVLSISSYFTYSYLDGIKSLFFKNQLMSFFYTDKTLSMPLYFILAVLLFLLIKSLSNVKNLLKNME
ncbi:Probable transmembrane protein [hydrothermal vent metagenome]|uniref:Probable transmembrane protein n=1 Tax=hydrothermal vent metagenome TaxID=652676 RepID=A0A3B1E4F7_9ZZZZ